MTRTIGIYVYDDVEVLDFAGPYEVFTCAARVSGKMAPDAPPPFQVRTIAQTAAMRRARAGLSVFPEADFSSAGRIDVLIVPGGVVTAELAKPPVVAWIAGMARDGELVAPVQTDATSSPSRAMPAIHATTGGLASSAVTTPPGTISTSIRPALEKSASGKTLRPARARRMAAVCAIVRTWNGGGASGAILPLTRAAQVKTSYGPAKSRTSTSS